MPSRLNRFQYVILATAATLALLLWIAAATRTAGHPGFPLDDAWIHQTYARNLAQSGQWAFIPGEPSAGSTAPLWSALLAIGYWLHLPPLVWTFFLGWLILLGLGIVGESSFRALQPDYHPRWPWVGLLLVLEWHDLWAAFSGMETGLFMLGIFWLGTRLLRPRRGAAGLGWLVGGLVWLRPDGITLTGPVLFTILLEESSWRQKWRQIASFLLTLSVPLAFYALFNLLLDGAVLPNTFYAKQTEYAALRMQPLLNRFLAQASMPLIGAGLLLLPAWGYWLWETGRKRNWAGISLALWMAGYLLIFALRLPVTYQHGRYQMPVMPLFFWTAAWGLWQIKPSLKGWQLWAISVWRTSIAGLLLAFFLTGALAYGRDVAFIENIMVATARWVAENIPPDARIAAHDIGALGYFAPHPILDLAGLVSPDAIPFIRDEVRLATWLDEQGVSYLVIQPATWYDTLPKGRERVYCTQSHISPMCVYRWR